MEKTALEWLFDAVYRDMPYSELLGLLADAKIMEKQQQDDFAIGFGQWMASGVEFIDDTKQGRIYDYKHKRYTTEQLLEIFKKENNL